MKTLKESWLHGEISIKSSKFRIMPIVHMAQSYFKNWTEKQARELWKDTEVLLKNFINGIGKISFMVNPFIILKDGLLFLPADTPEFKKSRLFLSKWEPKLQRIRLPHADHGATSQVLLAIYILMKASQGNACAVMDTNSVFTSQHFHIPNEQRKKQLHISNQNRKSAKAPRKSSIRLLLEHIFNQHPTCDRNQVIKRLKNQTKDDKGICIVEFINDSKDGKITFRIDKKNKNRKKTKTVAMKSFLPFISKCKSRVKNKLP